MCCGNAHRAFEEEKSRCWSQFANSPSCNSKLWAILLFGYFIKIEEYWSWQFPKTEEKKWCQWVLPGFIALEVVCMASKAVHKRPDMGRGHRNPTSNKLPSHLRVELMLEMEIHWASKETYHFFRATLTKIHSIKINHIWTQISFNTSQ